LSTAMMVNFLRANPDYQKYFQFCKECRTNPQFVNAEDLFNYEHLSPLKVSDCSHKQLLDEVFDGEFSTVPSPNRIRCDQFEEFMRKKKPDIRTEQGRADITEVFAKFMPDAKKFVSELIDFIHIEPKLPTSGQAGEKNYIPSQPIKISADMSREQIIDYLKSIRGTNIVADLAFYAYRDMESCDWKPFVKSAIERSPVSIEMAKDKSIEQTYQWLKDMPNESIYDGKRLAQPDEVANYGRGDGIEKAITLANILHKREPEKEISVRINGGSVVVEVEKKFEFESSKVFEKEITINKEEYKIR
jgi:hypothetical protein